MKLLLKPRTFKFSFRFTNFRQYDGKTDLYQPNELVLPGATFIAELTFTLYCGAIVHYLATLWKPCLVRAWVVIPEEKDSVEQQKRSFRLRLLHISHT